MWDHIPPFPCALAAGIALQKIAFWPWWLQKVSEVKRHWYLVFSTVHRVIIHPPPSVAVLQWSDFSSYSHHLNRAKDTFLLATLKTSISYALHHTNTPQKHTVFETKPQKQNVVFGILISMLHIYLYIHIKYMYIYICFPEWLVKTSHTCLDLVLHKRRLSVEEI